MVRNHRARFIAAVLVTAGFTALTAGGVSANDGTDADVEDDVDQEAIVDVYLQQKAFSNSGLNLAVNWTDQYNSADQESDSDADGGDAKGADALISTGGFGGTADALNDNSGSNDATSDNMIMSGAASADNSLTGDISQSHTNSSTNTATANAGAATTDDIGAGGTEHHTSTPTPAEADVDSDVNQYQAVYVGVDQTAAANSGLNAAVNVTTQGNSAYQDADSNANGGDSEGGLDASTGGDGGSAITTNTNSGANSASSSNSITTGDASATNSADLTVSQTSSNTSTNTAEANG